MFDKNGKYLYFTASTNSGVAMQPDIESFSRPVTRSVYLIVLSKSEPSPLAPESDDEKEEGRSQEGRRPRKDDAKDKTIRTKTKPTKVDVKIDLENIGQRILALPMPPRALRGICRRAKPGVCLRHRSAAVHRRKVRRCSRSIASI